MAQDTTGREYPDSNHPNWAGASRHPEATAPIEGATWGMPAGGTRSENSDRYVSANLERVALRKQAWDDHKNRLDVEERRYQAELDHIDDVYELRMGS
jgi:hypothetical protein